MFKNIPVFDKSLLNYYEEYIHQASQFLAMVGKNYLPNQADDSNANLSFDENQSKILGRDIGNFSLNLNVPEWQLEIEAFGLSENPISLVGKTEEGLINLLKDEITSKGYDGEKLKFIDHYKIPDHAMNNGHAFPEMNDSITRIWLTMRSNANILLADLNRIVGIESEIRLWPHHFDTGTYYSLDENRTIGAGWAMADTLCDSPYVYIYGWDGKAKIDFSSTPDLEIGKWIVTDGWQGAVIESEELSLSDNQYESSVSFMQTVTKFIKSQLNLIYH